MTINDLAIFFRMTDEGTEAILHNFAFLFDMPGTVGIDEDGRDAALLQISTSTFDLYANANGQDFKFVPFDNTLFTSIPMLLFGWRGGLENLDLRLRLKGLGLIAGTPWGLTVVEI